MSRVFRTRLGFAGAGSQDRWLDTQVGSVIVLAVVSVAFHSSCLPKSTYDPCPRKTDVRESGMLPGRLPVRMRGPVLYDLLGTGLQHRHVCVCEASGGSAPSTSDPIALTTNEVSFSLPGAGHPYFAQYSAEGGQPPYTWTLVSGSLPAGLSLSPNGQVSGVPTGEETSMYTLQVEDSTGSPGRRRATLSTSARRMPAALHRRSSTACPSSTSGRTSGYEPFVEADPPYSFTVINPLPDGCNIDPTTGTIYGIPSAGSGIAANTQYNFTVVAHDEGPNPGPDIQIQVGVTFGEAPSQEPGANNGTPAAPFDGTYNVTVGGSATAVAPTEWAAASPIRSP